MLSSVSAEFEFKGAISLTKDMFETLNTTIRKPEEDSKNS
jgi:hypothetical protein